MSVKLQVGDETFEYPITGSANYGEEATNWAIAVSDALKEVKGPGDISTREILITNFAPIPATETTALVTGLSFNVAFVQRVLVQGLITREYTTLSALPNKVETFSIDGAWNGSQLNFSQTGSGEDCEAVFSATGGQFFITFRNETDLETLRIKFNARVLIDENLI